MRSEQISVNCEMKEKKKSHPVAKVPVAASWFHHCMLKEHTQSSTQISLPIHQGSSIHLWLCANKVRLIGIKRGMHPWHFTRTILQVGDFAVDNRAGISRTLHRISAIRNRKGAIIGLTCRVGRAISGSAMLLWDFVQDGASLLLIGPLGVGKTTIIRLVTPLSYTTILKIDKHLIVVLVITLPPPWPWS